MLEPIGLDLGASGNLEACAIIGEAARRLRIPPHRTFHEEYNEDLEEEIENWMKRYVVGKDLRVINNDGADITPSDIYQIAHHFAEWQRKKAQETIELAEDHAMLAGMNMMKEEMMGNAVESTVKYEIGSAEIPQCDKRYQVLSDPTHIANAKLGDKVKIIIVKTEQ